MRVKTLKRIALNTRTAYPKKLTDLTLGDLVATEEQLSEVFHWDTPVPLGASNESDEAPSEPGLLRSDQVPRGNVARSQKIGHDLPEPGLVDSAADGALLGGVRSRGAGEVQGWHRPDTGARGHLDVRDDADRRAVAEERTGRRVALDC